MLVLFGAAGTENTEGITYRQVGEHELKIDIYLPEGEGPHPTIVWIHGGGWIIGDRSWCEIAEEANRRGLAVASIDYRLSGEARFPAQIEDCKAAIRWLRANSDKYNLDPDLFGVWGVSAGGHLAALVATDNNDPDSEVQAACVYCGLTNFDTITGRTSLYIINRLLGGPLNDNRELGREASPIFHIDGSECPFFIAHGDGDDLVPPSQSWELHEALTEAGVKSDLKMLSGEGHFFYRDEKHIVAGVDFFKKTLVEPDKTSMVMVMSAIQQRSALILFALSVLIATTFFFFHRSKQSDISLQRISNSSP